MSKTPPRSAVPLEEASKLQQTPWSAGPAAHQSFNTQNTQDEYKHYLAADIKDTVTIPFDELLFILFDLPSDWRNKFPAVSTIASSSQFQNLLHEYAGRVTHETHRYHPFNNLANCAIEALAQDFPTKEPIVLCRNDHVPINGSSATRIPDCITALESAMRRGARDSCDNLSKTGPQSDPFYWVELLAFFEFKLVKCYLGTPSTDPTSSAPTPRQKAMSSGSSGMKQRSAGRESSKGRIRAPATASASSTHPAVAGTPSGVATPLNTSPSTSRSKQSTFSRKRSQQDEVSSNKRQKQGPMMDAKTQCASYALEMMSHSGLRTHVFGVLITDDKLELLYYDRSQPVVSTPICFLQDPSSLVALLYCMQRSTSSQWGHSDVLKLKRLSSPDVPLTDPLHGSRLALNNGVDLELGNLVFFQHALIGRGTCVVHASVIGSGHKEWEGKSLVVKFSFTPTTRRAEGDILAEIIKHANSDINYKWVLNHLPEVLHHQKFPRTATQSRLSDYLKGKGMEYEERDLQVLVMTELFPITKLTTTSDLVPVIRGVFKCYRWLYEKVNLIHRDVSLNNIMYRQKAGEPVFGVLSDYDLSLFLTSEGHGPTSKQRTGTKPYMAIDLLQPVPPKHLYRHDLESLFYVIVVLTSRYHNGEEVKGSPPPLQAWFDLGMEALRDKKNSFLMLPTPQPTANFLEMRNWISKMREMFGIAILAGVNHGDLDDQATAEFDRSTLGGRVDFDKFGQILDLPILKGEKILTTSAETRG